MNGRDTTASQLASKVETEKDGKVMRIGIKTRTKCQGNNVIEKKKSQHVNAKVNIKGIN